MSFFGLVTAAVLLVPVGSPPQAGSPSQVELSETSTPLPPQVLPRPAEVVASRVRDVLLDHADATAWQDLAGALPDMALSGGADLESTFEAARMAEEMGAAPLPSPGTITTLQAREAVLDVLRSIDVERVGQLVAIALALFSLSILVRRSGSGRVGGRPSRGPTAVRCRQARSLAAGGVPAYEICRRTGLARDALTVLLSRGVS